MSCRPAGNMTQGNLLGPLARYYREVIKWGVTGVRRAWWGATA